MRRARLPLLLTAALALAPAGEVAWGKEAGEKPPARMRPPPIPSGSRAGLRGPLAPSPVLRAVPPVSRLTDPALRPLAGGGVASGALGAQPLSGLRAVADPAPQCRADCARGRYFCSAGADDSGCDDRWRQCVLSCRGPGLR